MKNLKPLTTALILLVAMFLVPAARGQSPLAKASSVKSSPSSDTGVSDKRSVIGDLPGTGNALISGCMATAVELEKTRVLVAALEDENKLLNERLATEKRSAAMLAELNETRKSEADALRAAVAAKNETIIAKDAFIAAQDKLVTELRSKKPSPWRRVGDILIGIGAGVMLR